MLICNFLKLKYNYIIDIGARVNEIPDSEKYNITNR